MGHSLLYNMDKIERGKKMKIYILDISNEKLQYFERYFKNTDVEFVCSELETFLFDTDVQCVVSPANAFGLMDGGYDYAITDYFGGQLQERVQEYILKNYGGEQPLGTSFLVKANRRGQCLIHTPTMQVPQRIKDPFIIYQCMRSTLLCAKQHKVKSIVIPLFGGGTGDVHPKVIAKMMYLGYKQIMNPPKSLDWDYAESIRVD